jgi:hypothetical protein
MLHQSDPDLVEIGVSYGPPNVAASKHIEMNGVQPDLNHFEWLTRHCEGLH